MFHQRQKGGYCRCHAINNLVGQELVSLSEFNKYCDEYDKINNFCAGSSKRGHLFYNNGNTDNIFGYILEKKGFLIKMDHFDFYRKKKIENCDKRTIGYIVYNRGHTWCIRIENGERWIIDSMKGAPQKMTSLAAIERAGLGVIRVVRK